MPTIRNWRAKMRPSSTLSLAALCAGLVTTPLAAQNVFTLDELVFSASLTDVARDRTGVRVNRISSTEMFRRGRLQFSEFLESLPGVNITQNGPIGTSATIRVRGLDWNYIPVRINGIDVTDPSSVQSRFDFGKLTSAGIASAEVLYGAQSAILGSGAIAGAVNITTVEAPEEIGSELGYSAEVGSYNTARTGLTYGTRFESGFLAMSLSHISTEGFSAADENVGNTEADGFDSIDFSLRGEFQASEIFTLGASLVLQNSNFEFDSSGGAGGDAPRYQDFQMNAGRIFATAALDRSVHEFGIEGSRTSRTDPLSGSRIIFEGERDKATYLGSYDLSAGNVLSIGAETMSERYYSATASSPTYADYQTHSIFGELLFSPVSAIDMSISARLTDNTDFGSKTTGRVAVAWRAGSNTLVRTSISTGFRAPSLNEMYGPFDSTPNPDLQPETSQSLEFGVEHQLGRLTADFTVFQTKITDLISWSSGYSQVPGTSRSDGYELGLSYSFVNDAQIGANFTSTDARAANGSRLNRVPRRDLSLSASTPINHNMNAAISLQSVSDRLESGIRFEDYTVVNANISHSLANGAELFLRIDNVFDEEYQTTRGYGTSDRALYIGVRGTF
ncbi:TonB-dependent receptor plug domain-containing protein [Roseobacter sp. HKCCA0882]|uniref:TonB-dependent receptor plug domain-containing protein n=1 Tax=Roseobacter sp. HKCCA0882 TaxID=3120337 RepID=UPI0030EB9A33